MRPPYRPLLCALVLMFAAMPLTSARAASCTPSATGYVGNVTVGSSSSDLYSWFYCGRHVRMRNLPVHFSVDTVGAPSSALQAARAAAAEWNDAWPLANPTSPTCPVICIDGVTSSTGTNTISWGSVDCTGTADAIAAWCGAWPAVGGRMPNGYIVLDSSTSWAWPNMNAQDVRGRASNLGNQEVIPSGPWFDLQSVIAHELGHSIGLEHFGDPSQPFSNNLGDTAFENVMYRVVYEGSTSGRALGSGDLSELQLDAQATAQDP